MKIARFELNGSVGYGAIQGESLFSLLGDLFGEFHVGGMVGSLSEAKILAPVIPTKIVAVGLNYAAHVKEYAPEREVPDEPVIFLKPSNTVVGPLESILYPAASTRVEHEAELAVVIGRRAKDVSEAQARQHILGYTCGNDITARDLQRKDGQWTRAKSFDSFCPLGPYIVTDLDASDLSISCKVNGVIKQQSRTSFLIHRVEKLVSFISGIMPLSPGDVIMTGTPDGPGPVMVGDVIEVEIEGIGMLRNPVVSAS